VRQPPNATFAASLRALHGLHRAGSEALVVNGEVIDAAEVTPASLEVAITAAEVTRERISATGCEWADEVINARTAPRFGGAL
jgi:ribosomal protein L18E